MIILKLSHPIVWLVWHVCSDQNWIFYFAEEDRFLMLFQTCTKLTFGRSHILVITVIARNRINNVGSLFFRDRILWFGKNIPQSLKRFLRNFNVVAIQNSLDGFRNTLNVDKKQRALATSPVKPSFSKRYVDDVIFAVSGNEAVRLLSH